MARWDQLGNLGVAPLAGYLAPSTSQRSHSTPLGSSKQLGPYRILSIIGAGGMGTVFAALGSSCLRQLDDLSAVLATGDVNPAENVAHAVGVHPARDIER